MVNASLAAGAVLVAIRAIHSPKFLRHFEHPLDAGLLFVTACLLLTLFVFVRNRIQRLLTRVIFLRANPEEPLRELRHLGRTAADEAEYMQNAAETIARFLHAANFELAGESSADSSWAQAIVPLRLSRGDTRMLLLGPRHGGRRYLSEDYDVLSRLVSAVVEHVEQVRELRMQNLVSQAELRALQAQINPHFLFNSLNTLYGTIARENTEARRLVLNLADLFRYLLHSDRQFIQVEEELKIVRAYLEIEKLRLGPKLRTEFEIEEATLHVTIPVLSIQPLVENAVKHGVAAREENGFVRIAIRKEPGAIRVAISNSGEFVAHDTVSAGPGIGLANVRRRLALHYGEQTRVEVSVTGGVTTVGFAAPLSVHRRRQSVGAETAAAHR